MDPSFPVCKGSSPPSINRHIFSESGIRGQECGLGEVSAGNSVAGGRYRVVPQDAQGGEYFDHISEAISLTYRKLAENAAVIGGQGVVLMENQAGKSFLKLFKTIF